MRIEEYETMFRVEDGHWWYVGLRRILEAFWFRHVSAKRPRVLDAGCGTGANLVALERWARPAGIDLSPHALRFCRQRGLTRTATASTTALPFPSACFDVVLSMDVLQHQAIADTSAALGEIGRVLRPDGVLLINLPAYQWLHSSHDVAVYQDRRFTRGELITILVSNGFEPLETTYWNTLLFPPAATVRLWRKLRPPDFSDLATAPGPVTNRVCGTLLGLERRLIQVVPLPFGLSVFAAARKT